VGHPIYRSNYDLGPGDACRKPEPFDDSDWTEEQIAEFRASREADEIFEGIERGF
jgi:hypothetical protein